MNHYGDAAVKAVSLCIGQGSSRSPRQAWERATNDIFGRGTSSQAKSCPRDTFLALCEEGLVKNIPRGHYTRSQKNKQYAIDAVSFLQRDPSVAADPAGLWKKVMRGADKVHNHQMNVVIALWSSGFIRR